MAARKRTRKDQKIKVISYFHVGTWGNLVRTEDLTPELRKKGATELSLKLLNARFAGQAVFYREGEEPPI